MRREFLAGHGIKATDPLPALSRFGKCGMGVFDGTGDFCKAAVYGFQVWISI
jgi:hypothetical protein